jgi:hypothetical protein
MTGQEICLGGISDKNKDLSPYPVRNIILYYIIQYNILKKLNTPCIIYLDTWYWYYELKQYNDTLTLTIKKCKSSWEKRGCLFY